MTAQDSIQVSSIYKITFTEEVKSLGELELCGAKPMLIQGLKHLKAYRTVLLEYKFMIPSEDIDIGSSYSQEEAWIDSFQDSNPIADEIELITHMYPESLNEDEI